MHYVFLVYGHADSDDHAATTVRASAGCVDVSDGPFREVDVPLSSVGVAELHDLDDALRVAKELAQQSAAVEIRPARSVR